MSISQTWPERPYSAMVPREPNRGGVLVAFDARDRICDATPARVFGDANTNWDLTKIIC